MVSELVISLALPYPHQKDELSSTALARPHNATIHSKQDLFFCSHAIGARSPTSMLPEPAPLQLPSQVLGPTLSDTESCEDLGLLLCSHAIRAASPVPSSSGLVPLYCPGVRACSPECFNEGAGLAFPFLCPHPQGQLSPLPQVVKVKGEGGWRGEGKKKEKGGGGREGRISHPYPYHLMADK